MKKSTKIITFQHKKVIDKILKDEIYKCNYESKFNRATPECYKTLCKKLNMTNSNDVVAPIFGWAKVLNRELSIDSETIGRALEMTGFDMNDYLMLELNIPIELISFQRFYNFVDCRCAEEGTDIFEYDTWENVFISYEDIEKTEDEIQAVFPYIKKEWVDGIYKVYKNKEQVKELKDKHLDEINEYLKMNRIPYDFEKIQ